MRRKGKNFEAADINLSVGMTYKSTIDVKDMEFVFTELGINLDAAYRMKAHFERSGFRVKAFVLPQPTLNMFGIPVTFGAVSGVACEVEK